jgi:hypothetical protein
MARTRPLQRLGEHVLPSKLSELLDNAMQLARVELAKIDFLQLPYVQVDKQAFGKALPSRTCAVYFLVYGGSELKYIGKAANLRSRWYFTGEQFFKREPYDVHHCLPRALELGNVTLHYWTMPKKYLSIVEVLLLREFKPPWNTHDVAET